MRARAGSRGLLLGALLGGALLLALPARGADDRASSRSGCGTSVWGLKDALWAHRERELRRGPVQFTSARGSFDVGDIAVLQDEGDLALFRNPMDLQGAGLQFTAEGALYRVARADRPLGGDPGTPLPLADDDTRAVSLPFPFSFYGRTYAEVFVNSDGNLTFGRGDRASTSRSLGRFLGGPPRIAPLFADLDPSAGGSVTVSTAGGRFTVAWRQVPQWERTDKNTFEVALLPDGRVEFAYGGELSRDIEEGVVGIAPGNEEGGMTAVDFSSPGSAAGAGALAESFHDETHLDTVAVARKFYGTHRDDYQQLIVFTSRILSARRFFAAELTVKNDVQGIGFEVLDFSAEYGSAGRLESFVSMDSIFKYSEDLERPLLGAESSLSILGQEAGHRWLTKAVFRDGPTISQELLGRDAVHWSFFADTDASHIEGNDIEDQGGGSFRTVGAGQRYSPLDQYLMGARPPEEVPPFFFVRSPQGSFRAPEDGPEVGVSFTGTRKDVAIADVLAAMGPRNPPAVANRPPYRQAFIYVSIGEPPEPAAIQRVERFRAAWEPYFGRSVDGRWSVDTRLN